MRCHGRFDSSVVVTMKFQWPMLFLCLQLLFVDALREQHAWTLEEVLNDPETRFPEDPLSPITNSTQVTSMTFYSAMDAIDKTTRVSKSLPSVRPNSNWAKRDSTSNVRLGLGRSLERLGLKVGATFRGSQDMGGKDGSCQFWQRGKLNWIDPGYNPYLVGVGSELFRSSHACGQCVLLYNPRTKNAIVSVITDYCPPPCSRHQLDLHRAGSSFLASGSSLNGQPYRGGPENFNNLLLWPVECDWQGRALEYYLDTGSSRFHMYLIITWATVPVRRLKVERMDAQFRRVQARATSVKHDSYGRWVAEFRGDAGKGYYRLTMGAIGTDEEVVDRLYWNGKAEVKVKGQRNFKLQGKRYGIRNWPLP